MIKLKKINAYVIEPTINVKAQIEFDYTDVYLREEDIAGIRMVNTNPHINDTWSDKEYNKYLDENKIKLCTILCRNMVENVKSVVVDEAVEKLKLL